MEDSILFLQFLNCYESLMNKFWKYTI